METTNIFQFLTIFSQNSTVLPKIANYEHIQLSTIGYNFCNAMNCQSTKSYTNVSENMDSTNIFLFLANFCIEFDCFTPK